jgi:hypothetical protein
MIDVGSADELLGSFASGTPVAVCPWRRSCRPAVRRAMDPLQVLRSD